jgi:hypothetical protein
MASFRKAIHWLLGAATYYLVWPIYYIHQIVSAAWLIYRLGRTTSSQPRKSSSRRIHRPCRDRLQSHLQDLENQKSKGWDYIPSQSKDEIRHPIAVVAVGWKVEKEESKPKTAERLSVLIQQYSDSSREIKAPSRLSASNPFEKMAAHTNVTRNFSKKLCILEQG